MAEHEIDAELVRKAQKGDKTAFDLLVRTSFVGYVGEMLRRCTLDKGLEIL